MKNILMIMMIACYQVFGLEIDEKLTLRLVNVSQTKKTILINRGAEDGLNEGDHAKFFLSTGLVARGVVIKVSPTRSVWSVYRVANSQYIVNDTVMKLKITPAIKLSSDNSKMIVTEDIPKQIDRSSDPRDLGIPLEEGADDLPEQGVVSTNRVSQVTWDDTPDISEHRFEVVSVLSLSIFSSSTISDNSNQPEFSDGDSSSHLLFGFEYYFNPDSFLGKFSIQGFYRSQNIKLLNSQGATLTENIDTMGGALNYHLFKTPRFASVFLPYVQVGLGVGGVSGQYAPGAENSGADTEDATGNVTSLNVGLGVKYTFKNKFGARFQVDYLTQTLNYEENGDNDIWTKKKSGISSFMGMSYRF